MSLPQLGAGSLYKITIYFVCTWNTIDFWSRIPCNDHTRVLLENAHWQCRGTVMGVRDPVFLRRRRPTKDLCLWHDFDSVVGAKILRLASLAQDDRVFVRTKNNRDRFLWEAVPVFSAFTAVS